MTRPPRISKSGRLRSATPSFSPRANGPDRAGPAFHVPMRRRSIAPSLPTGPRPDARPLGGEGAAPGWGIVSTPLPLGLIRPDRDRQARRSYAPAVDEMSAAGPGPISRLEARRSARPHHRYKVTPKSCPTCAGGLRAATSRASTTEAGSGQTRSGPGGMTRFPVVMG